MVSRKILVVEDHPDMMEIMRAMLTGIGYSDSVYVKTGPDALLKAEEEQPDLILMDIRIPGMSGLEAARKLKANPRTRSIPILGMSASGKGDDRNQCLHNGFDGYLSKPFPAHRLKEAVENLFVQNKNQICI